MKHLLILLALTFAIGAMLRASPSTTQSTTTAPGLMLTLDAMDDASHAKDTCVSRLLAIAVPEGFAASPFLAPGPFRATWAGFINLKIRGDYTFTAHGSGEFELAINGEPVLKATGDDLSVRPSDRIRLKKGANAIVAKYTSPPKGAASLRLYWAEKTQPPQPIPPTLFTHDASDGMLTDHQKLRTARVLFAPLRCAKCHTIDSAMPEAEMDAPALSQIGSRLKPDWMARWTNDPKSVRPDASMPRLFRGEAQMDPRALDVSAYLTSLGKAPPSADEFAPPDVQAGARLYAGLGCLACHSLEENESPHDRVSLRFIAQKWHQAALIEYLRDPHGDYKWNPMPDFKLSTDEARQLAAFIWSRAQTTRAASIDLSRASVERGRQLVTTSGCLNCHTLTDQQTSMQRSKIDQIDRGCVGAAPNAPDFDFTEAQRTALASLLALRGSPLLRDTAPDFAERQMRYLRCNACHDIDGRQDTWSSLGAEVEAIAKSIPATDDQLTGDQSRPSLTWVGEKLRTSWMERFIAGQVDYKPRPWLMARMPAFPAHARLLAKGLAQQHGVLPQAEAEKPVDEDMAQIGRTLVGKEGGFACSTCHGVGSAAATSPFEAHGPNLMYTTSRLREEFYHRWVGDPQRYEPGTRMPQYSDSKGKTALRDTLEGNAAKQFQAIWEYLRAGEKIEPPER